MPDLFDTELFKQVQLQHIFSDGKIFVDCIQKRPLEEINQQYSIKKKLPGFDLKQFVLDNFDLPVIYKTGYKTDAAVPIEQHLKALWEVLTRKPDKENGSLIPLPYPYIVPGGRFGEIYYWDSYFTMLGLREHNRTDLIENMINNFAFLLNNYGHIPNGNRSYYVSRSHPPFFSLMISVLAGIKNDNNVYIDYCKEMEKEYSYWQVGITTIQPDAATHHLVQLPDGEFLNRYYDDTPLPRQESYAEDFALSQESDQPAGHLFRHIRAGAESGWDFSSRLFADEKNMATIQTTDIIPVDLNCLLYILEKTLAKAKALSGDSNATAWFETKTAERKAAILKYCWNSEVNFFCDYNFVVKKQNTIITAAGLFPLFMNIATKEQALAVAEITKSRLLKDGGIVTTNNHTGQQWDAPNGWAPLQWIAVRGLLNYGHNELAITIAKRWVFLNEKVYEATGKLMEKYNVEDITKEAGGGEYPGQDGFGWTNGVYLALKKLLAN